MLKGRRLLTICMTVVVLLALMLAGTPALAADDGGSDVTLLGQVIYNMNQPYQQALAAQTQAYCESLGIELIIVDGKSDAEAITNGVDDLIVKQVQGIIVQPQDGASINTAVRAAQEAGIPIVTFFNQATDAPGPHVRLAEDVTAFELGAYCAEKWLEFYPDSKIVIGVIDEPLVPYVHEVRAGEFVKGVKSVQPEAEDYSYAGNGVRDDSYAVAEDLLQAHPDVNIVYGINADSALGALAAFKAAGRGTATDGVPDTELFASIDGTDGELLEMVDPNSPLKACMALSPAKNSVALVDAIIGTVNGEYPMDAETIIDEPDIVIDYWRWSFDEIQDFLTNDYLSDVDLATELANKA